MDLRKLLDQLKTAAYQGIQNVKGNVQAIANPATRSTWMQGFTPTIQQAAQTYQKVAPYVPMAPQFQQPKQIQQATKNWKGVVPAAYKIATNNPIMNFPVGRLTSFTSPVTNAYEVQGIKTPTVGNVLGAINPFKVYDQQTGRVFPQSPLYQMPKQQDVLNMAKRGDVKGMAKAWQPVTDSTVIGMAFGGGKSKATQIKIHPEDMNVMKDFAAVVDRLGPKANKIPLGQLGKDAQNIVEHYFGKKFSSVSNTQIKKLFDYALAKREGGLVIRPRGSIPAGLGTQEVEGLAKQAEKNLTPEQIKANQKLPGIMYSTSKKVAEGTSKVTKTPLSSEGAQEFQNWMNKSDINVKNKVGILDYLRTPDRVLEKIGLKKESNLVRKSYENYTKELPVEIDKITQWSKQVSPEANQRIFRYLDGQAPLTDPKEIKVAKEIQGYLSSWADKLGLPKEKRISNYITHIFDRDLIKKEFDPELAKLITDKVAGSVYDPFTQQRLGKLGYVEDTWRALDAYVKRGVRKVNMDPALKQIQQASDKLELSQFEYVKNYVDRINMRPTKWDNLLDNTIKQLVGYKFGQRPTTAISQGLRQMVYRGTLGLNPGSALKNLTQGANTYSKLGEKYTLKGYMDLAKNMMTGSDELERVGVLKNDFIQDRTINATKKFWEKIDKGLFSFFELAEKINRGSAYYGAKAKALSQGVNEAQAIEYAKSIVRDTQFTFGSIDTPPILQSDMGKTLLQFQSFNLKQSEFLGEMLKAKDVAGLTRFALANMVVLYTIGKAIGMDWKDVIPFSGVLTGQTKLGQTPPVKLGMDLLSAATGGKDQYGQEQDLQDRINTIGNDLIPFIPAGTQMKKTYEGLKATNQGYSESKAGRVQYPVSQSAESKARAGIFGKYTLPESKEYYNQKRTVLGEKQSELFKQSADKFGVYAKIISDRVQGDVEDKAKEQVKQTGEAGQTADKYFYYEDGQVKEILKNRELTEPKLTGNTELDKKRLQAYSSTIGKKIDDIVAMVDKDLITDSEAEKEILKLLDLQKSVKAKYAKPKTIKIKKTPMPKIKIASPKSVKIKLSKFKISKPKKAKKSLFKIKKTPKIKSFKII